MCVDVLCDGQNVKCLHLVSAPAPNMLVKDQSALQLYATSVIQILIVVRTDLLLSLVTSLPYLFSFPFGEIKNLHWGSTEFHIHLNICILQIHRCRCLAQRVRIKVRVISEGLSVRLVCSFAELVVEDMWVHPAHCKQKPLHTLTLTHLQSSVNHKCVLSDCWRNWSTWRKLIECHRERAISPQRART